SSFFFFTDSAHTGIYTLSLHDALPISFSEASGKTWSSTSPLPELEPALVPELVADFAGASAEGFVSVRSDAGEVETAGGKTFRGDRKSTRLNSSHVAISYAVFCLKKKK